MTTPITAKTVADKLRELATLARMEHPALAAYARAEADRLDPPAPKARKIVEAKWHNLVFTLPSPAKPEDAVACSDPPHWLHGARADFLRAVVLPLLADAPDGPIPDETVERAWRVYACIDDEVPPRVIEKERPNGMHYMRAALEAVRGLPGMAVVRAAARPEVLEWGVLDGALLSLSRYKTRDDALAECSVRNHYHHDRQDGVSARVVAIIADPGEGTV